MKLALILTAAVMVTGCATRKPQVVSAELQKKIEEQKIELRVLQQLTAAQRDVIRPVATPIQLPKWDTTPVRRPRAVTCQTFTIGERVHTDCTE